MTAPGPETDLARARALLDAAHAALPAMEQEAATFHDNARTTRLNTYRLELIQAYLRLAMLERGPAAPAAAEPADYYVAAEIALGQALAAESDFPAFLAVLLARLARSRTDGPAALAGNFRDTVGPAFRRAKLVHDLTEEGYQL